MVPVTVIEPLPFAPTVKQSPSVEPNASVPLFTLSVNCWSVPGNPGSFNWIASSPNRRIARLPMDCVGRVQIEVTADCSEGDEEASGNLASFVSLVGSCQPP